LGEIVEKGRRAVRVPRAGQRDGDGGNRDVLYSRSVPNTDLLRSIPMFEGLDQEDLDHLAHTLVERPFKGGQMIFHQGDRGSEMYIVAQGHVNIHLPGENSRRVSLKDISVGEYFGELALFDEKPRSASALATTDALLFELSRETLRGYLERRPGAAMAILRTMAERLRETNAMLSERAAKNAVEEIEKHLTWQDKLADTVAEFNGSWGFILLLMGITGMWFVINTPGLLGKEPLDAYPYQFFNLVLAVLVALQGPLIVMSQNRQTIKDRATAETDFKVNLKNEVNIETILREMGEFRAEANNRLEALEKHTAPLAIVPPTALRPLLSSLTDVTSDGGPAPVQSGTRSKERADEGQLAGK